MYIWTQRPWQHTKDLHKFQLDKIWALRRSRGHQVLPLTKKQSVIDTCWERKKSVFINEVTLSVSTTLHSRPQTHKMDSMFSVCMFSLFWYVTCSFYYPHFNAPGQTMLPAIHPFSWIHRWKTHTLALYTSAHFWPALLAQWLGSSKPLEASVPFSWLQAQHLLPLTFTPSSTPPNLPSAQMPGLPFHWHFPFPPTFWKMQLCGSQTVHLSQLSLFSSLPLS